MIAARIERAVEGTYNPTLLRTKGAGLLGGLETGSVSGASLVRLLSTFAAELCRYELSQQCTDPGP